MFWRHSRRIVATVAVFSIYAAGQVSRTTGAVQGRVVDQSGSAVTGATIRLTNPETKQTRTALTDSAGTFVMPGMPVAIYELRAESPGFASYQNNAVEVSVGSITSVVVRLAPQTVEQQVTVSAEPPP